MSPSPASYLAPYTRARQRKLRGARALLWVGPRDQRIRFEAIVRNCALAGRRVLDVGCGPADLLGYLRRRQIVPAHYTGLEAQSWLVRLARRRRYPDCTIVRADFVQEPGALAVGADVVIFSGSLNLLPSPEFYRALRAGWAATDEWLVFNFLSTPELSNADWLFWHPRAAVLRLAQQLSADVRVDDSYEKGDCTVVMRKTRGSSRH
jgi:Methyltransferase domain